jgi:4-oxalomesaconate tautomerase
MWMRGGTSKAAVFLAVDLPPDSAERDDLLLRIMGSPDALQIDGIGGATTLTSKVAVVSKSLRDDADIDYLFLQVGVTEGVVTDKQNCGNVLAAIGPFAVERGLVAGGDAECTIRIRMVNSDSIAIATFPTPGGLPDYSGAVQISGVPGAAAGIQLAFTGTEGSATGSLFPTGNVLDTIDGLDVTCVDNGMPVIVVEASSLGMTGYESYDDLLGAHDIIARVDALRQKAGARMGLRDVGQSSVPKTVVVSPAVHGGQVCTRSFIPTRPHTAIGVLAAVSTVTALLTPGAVGHSLTRTWRRDGTPVDVEHPSGHLLIDVELDVDGDNVRVGRSGVVRTARKLFDGEVFPRAAISHTNQ